MIRTKVIATIGPATNTVERLRDLIDAGVDVFRLNFSHGTPEQHASALKNIRKAAQDRGAIIAVLADLCGPKIRVDPVEDDSFEIESGDQIAITRNHLVGNAERISTNRPELIDEVAPGHCLLIDDGNVCLRVKEARDDELICECVVGGAISTRKGINAPDSTLEMAALTDKDKQDLSWAVEHGVDYIALSFVRRAHDIQELRALLPLSEMPPGIVSKIETAQALDHIDEIIEASDVVLVARGDLGVEMDLARVPIEQKMIARKCQQVGKPVIIATQMLQSMVENPTATRAEVSDVANAILDSADCVMLSAETSIGEYPVKSVQLMCRIAEITEDYLARNRTAARMDATATMRQVSTAIAHGASVVAEELEVRLVAVWSREGNTARLLSKCRLNRPVVGLSSDERVCRRMALYYGVFPVQLEPDDDKDRMLAAVDETLRAKELAEPGDMIVVVAGTRLARVGETNALLLHLVGRE
jgi:pyruvate kinase